MKKYLLFLCIFFSLNTFSTSALVYADNGDSSADIKIEAQVLKVEKEEILEKEGEKQFTQTLEVVIKSGIYQNKKTTAKNNNENIAASGARKFQPGDNVLLTISNGENGEIFFNVTDYDRTNALSWLFIFFFGLTILIGKGKGIASFIGMGLSLLIIIYFIIPQLLAGNDPFIVAFVASLIIIPLTFYLAHGINKKTTGAVIGTIITLFIVGLISNIAIEAGHLSGFASEDAGYLESENPGAINIKGLLLAGIIIGLLGILDDITISQAAIVYKLDEVSPCLSFRDLYTKAMDIGRDHIASVVNTLVLVYTSAALPLLLLLVNDPSPIKQILNEESIAEEIIRTLIASTGIVLAVPITTFLAAFMIKKIDRKKVVLQEAAARLRSK